MIFAVVLWLGPRCRHEIDQIIAIKWKLWQFIHWLWLHSASSINRKLKRNYTIRAVQIYDYGFHSAGEPTRWQQQKLPNGTAIIVMRCKRTPRPGNVPPMTSQNKRHSKCTKEMNTSQSITFHLFRVCPFTVATCDRKEWKFMNLWSMGTYKQTKRDELDASHFSLQFHSYVTVASWFHRYFENNSISSKDSICCDAAPLSDWMGPAENLFSFLEHPHSSSLGLFIGIMMIMARATESTRCQSSAKRMQKLNPKQEQNFKSILSISTDAHSATQFTASHCCVSVCAPLGSSDGRNEARLHI